MPIPAIIASAAENYRFNTGMLERAVDGLSPEEWLKRPGEHGNHIAWIAGHVSWTRGRVLHFLGTEWTRPGLDRFARGGKLEDGSAYPPPAALLELWRESALALNAGLEAVAEEILARPVTQGPPSLDGKISGVVNFLAIHETYHLGQIAYLRGWLGHKGVMG